MSVKIIHAHDIEVLKNPGKDSAQLLWPKNDPEAQVTITRVAMQPKAISERHSHAVSEQTWIVEQGTATLLMNAEETMPIKAGDVVRTPPGVVHGVKNTGDDVFIYLSVTTPPEDFSKFYADRS